ncbi:MAG: type II/IV secretion system ATPase subunit [Candidatus Norongarragalinales archaeon]
MKILQEYTLECDGVPAEIVIAEKDEEYINTYDLKHSRIRQATQVVLDYLKERIIEATNIKISEVLESREAEKVRERLVEKAHELVRAELSGLSKSEEDMLVGRLVHEMLGLGDLELLLADEWLEEIVVNSSREPVYVYHKKFGWLKTNLFVPTEEQIHNYASIIGRRVGKQITVLNPLMDAHLLSGNRVNATLAPVSSKGNGLTIRKFRAEPWTIINFIDPELNTLNSETAALLWQAVQYEMNVLIAGGTASGKTAFLNAMLVFTPPNQRVVSIEDTRELLLPNFLHWTPLVTREPNPEGKGEVSMLDLIVNSLRMRPDRIVLGEVRRQREAEVLFEAMHTGHAVYATLHADEARQVRSRLISPPIELPETMLGALHLIVVQYRQRRSGIRRTFEIAEVIPEEKGVSLNVIYKWDARDDKINKVTESVRLVNELSMHTGFNAKEIVDDLKEKKKVLEYALAKKIFNVNDVGRIVGWYYRDPQRLDKFVSKNLDPAPLLEKKTQ